MNLPLFLARRLYRRPVGESGAGRPAVSISVAGIALGVAVMLVSVAVVTGFKAAIREKITGFTSHVQIVRADGLTSALGTLNALPVEVSPALTDSLTHHPAVKALQRYSLCAGIIKTPQSFQGMLLKGVGEDYNLSFLRKHLLRGELPSFSDSASSGQVVISQNVARKMGLDVGQKMDTYFVDADGANMRTRRLQVAGIYQTHFSQFDDLYVFADLHTVNRLNGWERTQAGGLEVELRTEADMDEATWSLGEMVAGMDADARLCAVNVVQNNPSVFAWLDVLNVNVWVIMLLMTAIAGFTMTAGLLIIIIERTRLIGLLRALGAGSPLVRRVFLHMAAFIVGRGLLIGNGIALALIAAQKYMGLLRLAPETYYMDVVPVSLEWWMWVLLNVSTLAATLLMLLVPSGMVARVNPATAVRYD